MQKKIVILSSGHPPMDERIFWKFGRTLSINGYAVTICTSTQTMQTSTENITIDSFDGKNMNKKEKVNYFFSLLQKYEPDTIICCEPLTILAAAKYRSNRRNLVKIYSDVTEWYPENFTSRIKGIKKYFRAILLWILNIYSSNLTDGIIIGEKTKKRRYDIIAPFVKKAIIGYYPVIEFFPYAPPVFAGKHITFCYAGLINYSRGILTLLEVCKNFKEKQPEIEITLKLAGKWESTKEEEDFNEKIKEINNFNINLTGWKDYPSIHKVLADTDICFDLREHNFVYDNSLPIKVFEYMAAGKPFIFSNIKPLSEVPYILNCGFLVEPDDLENILEKIENYINDNNLLIKHSLAARKLVEEEYNWEKESKKLLRFIASENS